METHALWLTGPKSLEIRVEELPAPGPDHVLVRSRLSGISHGTEMLVYRGQVPPDLPLDLPTLAGSFAFPVKYGYASVGEVEAVGANVESLHMGDLVFTLHPHQDRYIVPATMTTRLPEATAAEAAVFLANLETAVNVMLDANLRFGETVVIFGQGVVGQLITMLARRSGASQVIAVDPIAQRRRRALTIGAGAVFPPNTGLASRIRDMTGGRGADVVIEVSGAPAALQQALDCATTQGTVVVASWHGTKPVSLLLGSAFHRRRLRVISSQVGLIDPALAPRWSLDRRRELAVSLLTDLPLEGLITHRVPFSRAADAYRLVDTRPSEVLQVVLDYGEE